MTRKPTGWNWIEKGRDWVAKGAKSSVWAYQIPDSVPSPQAGLWVVALLKKGGIKTLAYGNNAESVKALADELWAEGKKDGPGA